MECFSYREYGVGLELHLAGVPLDLLAEHFELPHWRRLQQPDESPARRLLVAGEDDGGFRIEVDGAVLLVSRDLSAIGRALEKIVQQTFASGSSNPIFVHAGAVAWQGQTYLLPGRTHSGKSTLVKALVDAGAGYLSDEFALIDVDTGRIRAYPRRLSLRGPPPCRLALPSPPALELENGFPLGGIFSLVYAGGEEQISRISWGKAVLILLANTVAAHRLGSSLLPVLSRACFGVPAWDGVRGEAPSAAQSVLQQIRQAGCQADA